MYAMALLGYILLDCAFFDMICFLPVIMSVICEAIKNVIYRSSSVGEGGGAPSPITLTGLKAARGYFKTGHSVMTQPNSLSLLLLRTRHF
jgi:hypothetical protein